MLYYIIFDLCSCSFLEDKNGNLIRCCTIKDCLDYLEYILKTNDFDNYTFKLICD